ncbi:hypothetical protein [Anaerotruncus colihominis]
MGGAVLNHTQAFWLQAVRAHCADRIRQTFGPLAYAQPAAEPQQSAGSGTDILQRAVGFMARGPRAPRVA